MTDRLADRERRYGRCSESIEDGRQWVNNKPLFTSAANFFTVLPSEFDLVEVGERAAVAYCHEWADNYTKHTAFGTVRMLHPAEFKKVS